MQKRYPLIDTLRGICIVLVVLHHIAYDLDTVLGVRFGFFSSSLFYYLRLGVVWMIFILSGISFSLSRDNFRRAGETLLAAMLLTVVTAVFYPRGLITVGVLHCLGVCRLIWALGVYKPAGRSHLLSALIFAALAAMFSGMGEGVLLLPFSGAVSLPGIRGLGWLGFPDELFWSADWFPLLSWAPVSFIGGSLGLYWRENGFPSLFEWDASPALTFIGRHALIVYLLHQPVIMGVLWLAA